MKVKFSALLLVVGLAVAGSACAADQSAQDFTSAKVNQLIASIAQERATLNDNPERVLDLVNELIIPHFDFVSISRWVLGANWKTASKAQRQAFVNEFKTLLVRTYAYALLEYSDQEMRYLPPEASPRPDRAVVKTEFMLDGGRTLPITYRMYSKQGQWKVIDVSVDGVSLTATYRGSFASEIKKSGLDQFITRLTERNAKPINPATQ